MPLKVSAIGLTPPRSDVSSLTGRGLTLLKVRNPEAGTASASAERAATVPRSVFIVRATVIFGFFRTFGTDCQVVSPIETVSADSRAHAESSRLTQFRLTAFKSGND